MPRVEEPMTVHCSKCPAEVKFIGMAKKGGTTSRGIVNAEPDPNGNIILEHGTGRVLTGEALEAAKKAAVPLYLSHFATCPAAQHFRGKRR
jgi:hypothetical protein